MQRRRKPLDDTALRQFIERYEAGLSIREVAAELGLPKTTVQNAQTKSEVVMRPARRVAKGRRRDAKGD